MAKKAKKPSDPHAELEELIKATRARLDHVDRILIESKPSKKAAPVKKPATAKTPKLVSRVVMGCVAAAALVTGLIMGLMFH